jgi:hypothetical protein
MASSTHPPSSAAKPAESQKPAMLAGSVAKPTTPTTIENASEPSSGVAKPIDTDGVAKPDVPTTTENASEPSSGVAKPIDTERPTAHRVATKYLVSHSKISPLTGGVEKPAEATEIWNIHCPSSDNHAFGIEARLGVWKTITEASASRSVVGGDMNMSRFQAESFNKDI